MQGGARRKRFLGGFILTGSRGRIPGIEEKVARGIVGSGSGGSQWHNGRQ